MSTYIFDNAGQQARQRFDSLEELYDPWTIRHLEATGIGPGWHCWEVGAGGGSIAAWLGGRCGPTGQVLATDLDPRFLAENAALAHPHITIERHDLVSDPLPTQRFDLIHGRLILAPIPSQAQALAQMVNALKPGGWLVLDEYDVALLEQTYPTTDTTAAVLYRKVRAAQDQLMSRRGVDLTWGRSLYQRLGAYGLADVRMEGTVTVWEGGSPGARLMQANYEQIREEATRAGLITNDEIDQVLRLLDDPSFALSSYMMFTAWGRRPARTAPAAAC